MNIIENLENNYIKYEDTTITIIIDNDNEIWFNAQEIATALDYAYPKMAIITHVDKSDKVQLQDINTNTKIKKHPHSIYLSESGLYSLILSSKVKKAKKFKQWITGEILPSIRKYGYYKLKSKYEKEKDDIMNKINKLEQTTKLLKNDLKDEKYNVGGLVYVIDYSADDEEVYRIGFTEDLNKRKKIYDTHTYHKRKVVYKKEFQHAKQLERCILVLLEDYRYKRRKDFFICPLNTIKIAFTKCANDIITMMKKENVLKGGGVDELSILYEEKDKLETRISMFDLLLKY
jgi:prophage antirepressor-like protein